MKKVLLHICCGVCAFASIGRLKKEGFYVEGFFFNPNIHPAGEYIKRKKVAVEVSRLCNTKIIMGEYRADDWFKECRALSDECEGARRCLVCYRLRLKRTFDTCVDKEFDYFTTTLTISPHKNSEQILEIGKRLGKDKFLSLDFKKEDGFKNTMELAKKHNFYRQNYCGCVYSTKKT
ncbi:MAG: epoxyqueuosine reductase QueH [Candidatus Omnitrophota bacterium]|nr:MAG: epoxyqueuosine reductase QueH [Candidatus Omnitrophota bacterium]